MKHTPTPLHMPLHVSKLKALPFVVCDKRGVVIANCNVAEDYLTEYECREHAAFIVEACNAYEGLKEEKKAVREMLEKALRCLNGPITTPQAVPFILKKAIALCEGEGE